MATGTRQAGPKPPGPAASTTHGWDELPLPAERHCTVFETAIGHCGIAWRGEAISHVVLPGSDAEATLEALRWASGAAVLPPPWPGFVTAAVAGMQALLRGETGAGLEAAPLDWAGIGRFERRVFEATRRIAAGRTVTYSELAVHLGIHGAERAVVVALSGNPWPLLVPSHRVVAAEGEQAARSSPIQRRLRAIEAALGSVRRRR